MEDEAYDVQTNQEHDCMRHIQTKPIFKVSNCFFRTLKELLRKDD